MSTEETQQCAKCRETKLIIEYDYYKRNEVLHRRKTCNTCIPHTLVDETQNKINYTINEIKKYSHNHLMLEQLATNLLQYAKWKGIEAKATDENSIIIKIHNIDELKIDQIQKSAYDKLQKEIPLEDIHVITYSRSYMIFIENPLMKSYLWVLLN